MFTQTRLKLRVWFKNLFSGRDPQVKFVNPYAMTEPTTRPYYVKPQFKDGRFILEKEQPEAPVAEKKKKEPGFAKTCIDVVISDLEKISGESKRKAMEVSREKEAYKRFSDSMKAKKVSEKDVLKPVKVDDDWTVWTVEEVSERK